jgi:DNA-binding NtrC family response regulator
VIEATDASRAIELLESGRKVSLVFSDIRMPGPLSGYDLAAWVAEHRPGVKILLTTGYSEFEASDDYSLKVLPKPYSIKALANALRDALG